MDIPAVLCVKPPVLYLEYIDSASIRDYLKDLLHGDIKNGQVLSLVKEMGGIMGRLHSLGVVHGDLTTSNMMLRRHMSSDGDSSNAAKVSSANQAPLVVIDFGPSKNTESAEERVVDLYVWNKHYLPLTLDYQPVFWRNC